MPSASPLPRPLVQAATAAQWRAWLSKNHRTKTEAWLVLYTKASGKRFVAYDDAVEAALCYGWIDSIVKSIGPNARAQRYTPRRPGSPVSELNRARVRKLHAKGKMTQAGLDALPNLDAWLDPPPLVLARDVERRLRGDPKAWRHFRSFPEEYKRIRVGWIEAARAQPEVFERRLRHFVAMSAQGKRFGTLP